MKTLLHVGCGLKDKANTTNGFNTDQWREVRVDVDPSVNPDLIGSITDLSALGDQSVDGVFSSHNIEHLFPHEVPLALAEFNRVLKPDGIFVLTCPDLRSICSLIAEDKLDDPAYHSVAGPITPLDVLYGHRASLAKGRLFMAHRGGFTQKTLTACLHSAGFVSVAAMTRSEPPFFDIWALALKTELSRESILSLIADHFPPQGV
jgi:hypothetical protein